MDPRVTPVRDGVASRRLEGLAPAEVYLGPVPRVCAVPAAAIRAEPRPDAEQLDQLLFGEIFETLQPAGDGFFWGQAARDGYVGFVAGGDLAPGGPAPTHRVSALRTYLFAEPSIKSRAAGPYSMNALMAIDAVDGRFGRASGGGWAVLDHLSGIGCFESDPTAVAERFVGAAYLWGGRESHGLDCSGLVQAALFACGRACPRDTDQQQQTGAPIGRADFSRGDLVFWKGHVAMGLDEVRIVHANAHHMAVAIERLDEAAARILAAGGGAPTAFRRLKG